MFELMNKAQEAQNFLENERRIKSANNLYKELLAHYPEHSQFVNYNYGVLFRSFVGDGVRARNCFIASIKDRNRNLPDQGVLDTLEANACENLMLLSLSYDDYFNYAEQLEKLQPENPILKEDRIEFVQKFYDDDQPWYLVMQGRAETFFSYRPDEHPDKGMWAEGASTFDLILENSSQLRVPREKYRMYLLTYSALITQLAAKYGMEMEQKFGQADKEEFVFIAEKAISYLENFKKKNPTDERILKSLDTLIEMLGETKRSNSSAEERKIFQSVIMGETICHNQILIRSNDVNELYLIIAQLSEMLLTPFPKTPSLERYNEAVSSEFAMILMVQRRWGKDKIILFKDQTRSSVEFSCLVGTEQIEAEAWVHNSIGMEKVSKGIELSSALHHFERALELSPNYFYALYNAAACNAELGSYEKAVAYYERALNLKPDDQDVKNELRFAKSHLPINAHEENSPSSRFHKALALTNSAFDDANQGRFDLARDKLESSLSLSDNIAETHNEYAYVLKHFGETQKAYEHLIKAVCLSPEDPKFWNGLGAWYFEARQYFQALTCTLVVEELDPSYRLLPTAKEHIFQVLRPSMSKVQEYREQAYLLKKMVIEKTLLPDGFDEYLSTIDYKENTNPGCFIATATYGSSEHPNVIVFRSVRDKVLLKTKIGRLTVGLYYAVSPILAKIISKNSFLRALSYKMLNELVRYLKHCEVLKDES